MIFFIVNFPNTTSVKTLHTTLGNKGYYRKIIRNYAKITTPVENLLEKESKHGWTSECQDEFDMLKEKLVTVPIIIFPYWLNIFHVHVDASSIVQKIVLA